jgi:HB1, ASXL, restriction endonuclease HTH domain
MKKVVVEQGIQEAQAELLELLARAERLKEYIAVSKKLLRRSGSMGSESEVSPFLPRRRKTNSLAEEVTRILLAARKPLHVSEIISELQKTNYPITAKNPAATIAVALSRRPFEFEKVGPNTFVLAPMREAAGTVEEIKLREN